MRLFSTEQVSKYHPDKYADQISDAILTECLRQDPRSHVACETLVKDKTVVLAGEITTGAKVDYQEIVKRVAAKLGYQVTKIINLIGQQSQEIAAGIGEGERQGAGDQGLMFGYATAETESFLPYGFHCVNKIIKAIEADVAREGSILKGDAKAQVTVDLDQRPGKAQLHTILVSVCSSDDMPLETVRGYVLSLIIQALGAIPKRVKILINPAGKWTVGGPIADCGLTGRKIVCDQYGGYTPVGGGAFSGKDPSKVDRSGAYIARDIAVYVVRKYPVPECTVQLAYGIGIEQPLSVDIRTGVPEVDSVVEEDVRKAYDLTPRGIIKQLQLLTIDYEKLAEGCHFYADRS